MVSSSWLFADSRGSARATPEIVTAYRARQAVLEDARLQQRQLDLEGQRSNYNPPDVRIRHWEKLHGLRLPMDAEHPVLDVIAISTRLTLAEVQGEQLARRMQRV